MTSSSKRALGIAAMLAVVLAVYVLLHLPGPSDQQQILNQLESARAAAQGHDVNGVMRIISAQYQDSNGLNNDQLAFLLRRSMNSQGSEASGDVVVTVSTSSIAVQGNTALSTSQLTVSQLPDNTMLYSQPVTLRWKKEDGTHWLVFPTKVWRIVGADYTLPEAGGL